MLNLRLAIEARQKLIEFVSAYEIAHRDMWHRLETGCTQPGRGGNRFLRRPSRHGADIDARAARKAHKRGDIPIRRAGRFQ